MKLPRTPSFRLDERRALVTGASSGIGLGAAVALAEAGAAVTLVARRPAELDGVRDAIRAIDGLAEAMALDITDLEATAAFIADAEPFDILVNAAGRAQHGPAIETTYDAYDAVMDLNVRAAYFVTREVAKRLIADGRPGSLINISSQMGHVGGPDRAVYCATKHALEGMTKAMALEWAPYGLRVNTICPTFIRTPLAEQTLSDPDRRAWVLSRIKLGRLGEIEDIMGAVVFLASDASAMVTGTHLIIDGGWTAE
ncbi:MAG TPA: SDR family oxidoreductase [Mesorhizobium sp.]|jgi:NAD(P)-dependent dehydrogenase (short-subunit alcohol dehydrogenase family)|uniref:SDR family NAD(P)-dependent oxidoreductase n=1 Tax=Mesorhizobium sp. TaxID=1871066 RepID=UPI002DDD532C|nr:SDR family oxidoreductase [Mesorhizobium sp.]HEV2501832.1 SDR family oxidoreductase [Mesorhizobium sp.]